ncbi:hypothetical protein TSAR_006235 [Trichomalopsis sarcophagae]|uniref:Uncharacterized protein n=1 Tax=Trichomalopsis sarcophagae TaxID=543379 RepID=A0A232EJR8_9HYME|nr:hypothetical protein TSAR_006235 [Trichomalopsis sarcophagae]
MYRMTILTDTSDGFPTVSAIFERNLVAVFPSLVVDINESNMIPHNLKSLLLSESEGEIVYVMFSGVNPVFLAMRYIEYMIFNTAETERPKCIIFVLSNETSTNFYIFYRFIWMHDFLDITIVELLQKNQVGNKLNKPSNFLKRTLVHQYNPFIDTYKKEYFSLNTKIFTNKLNNFYGYPLSTAAYDSIPSSLLTDDLMFGKDARVIESISSASNFSFKLSVATSYEVIYFVANGIVDFSATFFQAATPLENQTPTYRTSIFVQSSSTHLLVRQYPKFKTVMTPKSIIVVIVFALVVVVFIISVWLLKLDFQTWTVYNVIQLLIGNSVTFEIRTFKERIVFICLVLVFVSFSTCMLDTALQIFLRKKTYDTLDTIHDALNIGIRPCIPDMYAIKGIPNDSIIHKMIERSVSDCDPDILTFEVNCILVSTDNGQALESLFSRNIDGWIIKLIKEPLMPSWTCMLFSKTSPYIGRFNEIIRRLIEAGLIALWSEWDKSWFINNLVKFDERNAMFAKNIHKLFIGSFQGSI